VCGIAGFWDRRGTTASEMEHVLASMTATLRHRGPDDGGTFVDRSTGVGLGNRRLAIVDLSPQGHQPMSSPDGRYVLTFNGEIYNFSDLRRELEASGLRILGSSDTEVLAAAIQRWGVAGALTRSNGMFAVAVWDRREHVLHLARDRFGEKPLYYGWSDRVFLFGSELKALRAHRAFTAAIDRDALALYFRHNCIPSPYSIYSGIRKLTPGTVLTMGEGTPTGVVPEPVAYWALRDVVESGSSKRSASGGPDRVDDALDQLDRVLGRAVRIRMHADVPLGAFLSGGIDSSLVVSMMQASHSPKVRTFTMAFEDSAYDEADDARRVAAHLGTEHVELTVAAADALSIIPTLPEIYDEPFADSSQIPTAMLSRLTRRHVEVALSGDGGDELFGGYNRYVWAEHFWRRVGRVPRALRRPTAKALAAVPPRSFDGLWRRLSPAMPRSMRVRTPGTKIQKVARVLPAKDLDETYLSLSSHFEDPARLVVGATEPPSLLRKPGEWPDAGGPVERMMYLDSMTYLPDDILVKVDRATMAASLEGRMPFLDHELAQFAWSLPVEMKVQGGTGKWLLKRLLGRYVPSEIVDRPKAGFGVPLDAWLRGPLRPWAEDLLSQQRLSRDGYLSPGPVRRIWSEHLSGHRSFEYELWDVLMFQQWLSANRDASSAHPADTECVHR
jgi:asparagine synthase (glutamine-hydrolysing)